MDILNEIVTTFPVDAGEASVIKRGTRLKFVDTAGVLGLGTAGVGDLSVGTAEEDWNPDTDAGAPSQGLAVRLHALPNVFKASAAIGDATQLAKAAGGQVAAGSDMDYVTYRGASAADELVTAYKLG